MPGPLEDTASGIVGAVCCVYTGLPFDVVKVRMQTRREAGALAVDSCGVCGGDDRACAYTTYQLRGNYTFLGAASEMQIYDSLRSYYRNFWDGRDRPRADIGIVFPYVQHHKVSLEPFNAL